MWFLLACLDPVELEKGGRDSVGGWVVVVLSVAREETGKSSKVGLAEEKD